MFDTLTSLPDVVHFDVVLTGDWGTSAEDQREWRGEATAEAAIVGILFLSCGNRTYWVKSNTSYLRVTPQVWEAQPVSNHLFMALRLQGTLGLKVQLRYALSAPWNAIHKASTTLRSNDYQPPIPPSRTVQTGQLFTFARLESTPEAALYAMFLAKQDVKMRRKHIWGLRPPLLAGLPPPLSAVFTYGRFGDFDS